MVCLADVMVRCDLYVIVRARRARSNLLLRRQACLSGFSPRSEAIASRLTVTRTDRRQYRTSYATDRDAFSNGVGLCNAQFYAW